MTPEEQRAHAWFPIHLLWAHALLAAAFGVFWHPDWFTLAGWLLFAASAATLAVFSSLGCR